MSFEEQRELMIHEQLKARGLTDQRLLNAFRNVPRELFVPEELQEKAYADHPLPIGGGQTISQPYIVALMTNQLHLQGHERVLEIGTGSGYQTAILAELCLEVFSVERLLDLRLAVNRRLEGLGYMNVHLTEGNGSLGWPDHAPYDGILVGAAAPDVPPPLLAQLAEHGHMVIPIGSQQSQTLIEVEKRGNAIHRRNLVNCMFVPLIGEYGWPPEGES